MDESASDALSPLANRRTCTHIGAHGAILPAVSLRVQLSPLGWWGGGTGGRLKDLHLVLPGFRQRRKEKVLQVGV